MKTICIEDLKIYMDLEDVSDDYIDVFDIEYPWGKRLPTIEELLFIQPIDIKGLVFFADFYVCTVKEHYLALLNMDTGVVSFNVKDIPYRVRLVQDV